MDWASTRYSAEVVCQRIASKRLSARLADSFSRELDGAAVQLITMLRTTKSISCGRAVDWRPVSEADGIIMGGLSNKTPSAVRLRE